MTDTARRRAAPLKIEIEAEAPAAPSPQDAPPVGAVVETTRAPAPARSWGRFWARLFWAALGTLISAAIVVWVYDFAADLMSRYVWLGWAAVGLAGLAALALLALALRELAALGRIRRVARIQGLAAAAQKSGSAQDAKAVAAELERLYATRHDLDWAKERVWERLRDRAADAVDGPARLALYEREVMGPLDARAQAAVRRAAGRVAAVTALMPSALIDAAATLYYNLAMIRNVAEIYGGRAGTIGMIRLARKVVGHAMAAGLIALGDDLLEPLIGGGLASKLSRRAGEGVVNGALTARIGAAAMQVCRPMPFETLSKPRLRDLAWEALKGAREKGG